MRYLLILLIGIALSACGGANDTCGNGVVEGNEQCDGQNLGGQSCTDLGYGGGTLACTAGCRLDTGGCAGGPDPTCDNDLQVPAGYPPLGGDCKTHLRDVFSVNHDHWSPMSSIFDDQEFIPAVSSRGTRVQVDGRYDFGYPSQTVFSEGFVLPGIDPGIYTPSQGAYLFQYLVPAARMSANEGGDLVVEIAGRNGDVFWGRFRAILCDVDGCITGHGVFSSILESDPSALEWGEFTPLDDPNQVCFETADCPVPQGCAVSECQSGICASTPPC